MRKYIKLDYARIGDPTRKKYDELGLPISYDVFRKACKLYLNTGYERQVVVNEKIQSQQIAMNIMGTMEVSKAKPVENEIDYEKEVLHLLQKNKSLVHLDRDRCANEIAKLQAQGYKIDIALTSSGAIDYSLRKSKLDDAKVFNKDWDGMRKIKIGVVSDTHIGNKNTQMSFLNHLYDVFEEEGIRDVYHCGDITDGWYTNRSDQVYELFVHGADQQVDYVVENYPRRRNMITHFITGNHDFTFVRNTGYDIGPAIARQRDDMEYLGLNNAIVNLTPNCKMELNHPGDGSSYAMSYSIQKYIDSMMGGEKPNILLNGHHHKYMALFYRNIHAFEVPCTEAQTNFMKSKRLAAHVGGLILEIYVTEDGTIDRIKQELIPLYKPLKEDY